MDPTTVGEGEWITGQCILCKRHTQVEKLQPTMEEIIDLFPDGTDIKVITEALKPTYVCARCQHGIQKSVEREEGDGKESIR